jgi:hypothetical protein
MSRGRVALAVGILLLVAACAVPGALFAELSAASLPYQDPTAPPTSCDVASSDVSDDGMALIDA